MTNTHVIGIAGKAGYGKSTIAKLIKESTVESVDIVSFATPLKQCLLQIFPYLRMEHFTDQELKSIPISRFSNQTPRKLMQSFATDFARSFDDDIWIHHAELRIQTVLSHKRKSDNSPGFIVFDDVRHENEVHLIRQFNGTIIHIERDEQIKDVHWIKKLFPTKEKIHPSETGVRHLFDEKRDFTINTSGTIDQTKADVMRFAACRFDKTYEV